MSKYNTIEVWNKIFGNKTEIYDYAGRLIKKSACGNPYSKFFPTIDHIRPLSRGGCDILANIIICHRDTNEEKGDSFPHWMAMVGDIKRCVLEEQEMNMKYMNKNNGGNDYG